MEVNFSGLDTLVDEVVVHFDMLSTHVKYGVSCQVDVAHVVTV